MESINDRIKELIEYQGFTAHGYEKKFGFSRGTLSNIITGRRTKPGFDVLEKLITSNERVSVTWLMKGEGAMLIDESYINKSTTTVVQEPGQDGYVKKGDSIQGSSVQFIEDLLSDLTSIKQRLKKLES